LLERLGSDWSIVGLEGAGTVHASALSSTPSFSKLRLRSNSFFSCKIDSIVIEPDEEPVSTGKSASATNVFNVWPSELVDHQMTSGNLTSVYPLARRNRATSSDADGSIIATWRVLDWCSAQQNLVLLSRVRVDGTSLPTTSSAVWDTLVALSYQRPAAKNVIPYNGRFTTV
jgi:hypothetical protein